MNTPHTPTEIVVLPVDDSDAHARRMRHLLDIPRPTAAELGREAVAITDAGGYRLGDNGRVVIRGAVDRAVRAKVSVAPSDVLPPAPSGPHAHRLTVGVCNDTTLAAALRLADAGKRPLALNLAAPVNVGGGFLTGARAQEESLCRSSGLYATLLGDGFYEYHAARDSRVASDWAIVSPDVPVFRADEGYLLPEPWFCSFLTCAAPQGKRIGQEIATQAMQSRVPRVLEIARAHGYTSLVLGAWGCGAFGCDPVAVSGLFRDALLGPYLGAFSDVVFAIADWSEERTYLGPFCDAFAQVAV